MPRKPTRRTDASVFIPWYRRDQWDEWLEISADRDIFEDTYDEWLQAANRDIKPIREAVAYCVKVDIDVHEFQEWCKLNDRPLDGESRVAYAIELGKQKFKLN